MIKKIKNLRCVYFLGMAILFLSLSFYIYQVNAETTEKYSIQDYQKEISRLSQENKDLQINSAEVSSLETITQVINGLGFEKTEEIHYIQVIDTQVVVSK